MSRTIEDVQHEADAVTAEVIDEKQISCSNSRLFIDGGLFPILIHVIENTI